MQIAGLENLTPEGLDTEIERGARFVHFQYCVSIIILTFKRSSKIHFVRAGESAVGKGLLYTLVSLLFGWWGFPWGPIYTVGTTVTNFGGGKDVTHDVLDVLRPNRRAPARVERPVLSGTLF